MINFRNFSTRLRALIPSHATNTKFFCEGNKISIDQKYISRKLAVEKTKLQQKKARELQRREKTEERLKQNQEQKR